MTDRVPSTDPTKRAESSARAARPILIVEDDADLREMMAQLLTLEGFQADTVANGREALDYLTDRGRPSLILLDLMMPVMDGWELTRVLRSDAAMADVPVIVLSALDPRRAGDLNAPFLKKPLDFDKLLAMIRGYCGDRRPRDS